MSYDPGAWWSGLDPLVEQADRLRGRRYGLLAHAASVTADLVPAHLALARAGHPPAVLFGPEHGYHGAEQDMVPTGDRTDPWSGVPIRSLYGASAESLRPAPEAFDGLDLLVIDLQDVGSRYYTYAATAFWASEVAREAGCQVWVIDRPNPLGRTLEGNLPEAGYESFVGAFRTPVRHGLSSGEILQVEWLRKHGRVGVEVTFLMGWDEEDDDDAARWAHHPWVAPSPNMPDLDTVYVYPGLCLVEATEVSEGRGTTRPFRLVGAPGVDGPELAARLAARELPGVAFLPAMFRPGYQKHAGALCEGVEIVVVERAAVRGYRLGVEVLWALKEVMGEEFRWREAPYEFVADRPAVDLLAGTDVLRRAVDGGDRGLLEEWVARWEADEAVFERELEEMFG